MPFRYHLGLGQWRFAALILAVSIAIIGLLFLTKPAPKRRVTNERHWQVNAWKIQSGTYSANVILYGLVESPRATTIESAISATVDHVWVRDGDLVAKGAKLVSLDPREAQYALQARQANVDELAALIDAELIQNQSDQKALINENKLVELLQNDVNRQQELLDRQVGSSAGLEDAIENLQKQKLQLLQRELTLKNHDNRLSQLRAKYNNAKASLDHAKLDLERSQITAPFSGRVTQLHVVRGNRVQPGDVVVEIYDVDDIEIRAPVPTRYLPAIRVALDRQQVLTGSANVDNHQLELQFMRLAGRVNQGRSGVDALLRIITSNVTLVLGRSVEVSLNLPKQTNVYLLPEEALYAGRYVYMIDNQRLRRVTITRVGQITQQHYTYALVRSTELTDGIVVMTTHLPNARSGLLVEPTIARAVIFE